MIETPTFAVLTKNRTNPAYAGARAGIDRYMAAEGCRAVHYVPKIPDDIDQQAALVAEAIAARPDAILMAPAHATRLKTSIDAIVAAGIPLFFFVSETDPSPAVCYVGSDDVALGAATGERMGRHLGGTGAVLLVNGHPNAGTTAPRREGFLKGLAAFPGIEVLGDCPGDYQYDTAERAFSDMLPGLVRLDGVLAANDFMAHAVIDVLAKAGRTATVIGANATPDGIALIKQGKLLASAAFDAMSLAVIAAEAALRTLRGETVPARIELPVDLVDAGNLAKWDRDYADRETMPWGRAVGAG